MVNKLGNNLPKIKKENVSLIKEIIYKYGPISRSEIAEMLALTIPTITTNIVELIKKGIVQECTDENEERENSKTLGRRAQKIALIGGYAYVIGGELGPYFTSLCITDLRGNICIREKLPVAPVQYKEMLNGLIQSIELLIEQSGIKKEMILGICMGLPGFIEGHEGIIRSSFRGDWNNKHLAQDLTERTGLASRIENNVRLRAIGTEVLDREINTDTFAYYYISQGIACPLIIKSSMLSGETAGAGEVGHMVVQVNGPKCDTCGNHGCLEAISSEKAILKKCRQALEIGTPTLLQEICSDPQKPQMSEILKAQEMGDAAVCMILKEAIRYLGVALANIINFISPHSVIVDGYIMKLPQNRELLLQVTQENLFGLNREEVKITFVEYDPFSGAKGAAALAIKKYFIKS